MVDAAKLLDEALASVRAVRDSLHRPTPQALSEAFAQLQTAAEALRKANLLLRQCSTGARADRADLGQSASALQRDLSQLGALLDTCMRFTSGWSCCLSARVSGYTSGGLPRLAAGLPVSLEG